MARRVWDEKNIINEVNLMGITFLYFIKFDKYKSKFMAQCSYEHEPYETNLNTLHKGRKAMGCPICKSINKSQTNINKVNFNELKEYIEQHNHMLLTKKEDYNGLDTKLIIQCLDCKIIEEITFSAFEKRVNKCLNCKDIERYNEVLNKCNIIGFTLLDKEIKGTKTPINMLCDKKHKISPSYDSFIGKDCLCYECKGLSKGEVKIQNFLLDNDIKFEPHYRGFELLYKKHLEFDIYIPKLNIVIEFDGIQHFEPQEHFGGLESFKDLKIKDNLKDEFCQRNNIKLIRIPYWDYDNIEEILIKELNL